jgi:hypothetical protein
MPLKHRNDNQKAVFDNAAVAVAIMTLDRRIVQVNPINNILGKLGVDNRVSAVALALQRKLV